MKASRTIQNILTFTLLTWVSCGVTAAPLGTTFTYQGRLNDGPNPASGSYDFRFAIHDAAESGAQLGLTLTNAAITVSNGLFAVALDFGEGVFTGDARWLEISVRTNGSPADFATLSPRQPLTPTPYALHTPSAGTAASATAASSVPWAGLTSLPAGFADGVDNDTTYVNGEGLLLTGTTFSLHMDWLQDVFDDRYHERFWSLTGNAGTTPGTHFLGTSDNQPLEFKVNGQRALRLEPNGGYPPNVIGGYSNNYVAPGLSGVTISGGGFIGFPNAAGGEQATIAGGYRNTNNSYGGTLGGGMGSTIQSNANAATIAGGQGHMVQSNAISSTIGGGSGNLIQAGAQGATIAGGSGNAIQTNSFYTVIGGGSGNTILSNAAWATVPGGRLNTAGASLTFAAGRRAKALHAGAFVWADATDADFASTTTNQFAVRANGGVRLETAGTGLYIDGQPVFVNGKLATNTLTVNAGPGLSGGGVVALGDTTTLTNTGVLSVTGNSDITATTVNGAVTLATTATSAATPGTLVKRDAGGSVAVTNLTLNGNLYLPGTTASAGILYSGGSPLLHSYGGQNLFVGVDAGNLTMTGGYNTGNGEGALHSNTNGHDNTANGSLALYHNLSGSDNTANGTQALYSNTSGWGNTANGTYALFYNLNGFRNTASGAKALFYNGSGFDNAANGYEALLYNTTGSNNAAHGASALLYNTSGSFNTAQGAYALFNNSNGNQNTANGASALYFNTTGSSNAATGARALFHNTSGSGNTANGCEALYSNTTGPCNTANGHQALFSGTNGGFNTANGYQALYYNDGIFNTANGYQALYSNTHGMCNAANGDSALYANTDGSENTATGSGALFANTRGGDNTASGFAALVSNTSGSGNTATGSGTLYSSTNSVRNTAHGYHALYFSNGGSNNLALGYRAGVYVATGSSNIEIGNEGTSGDSEVIRLGTQGTQTNTFIAGIYGATAAGGVAVYVNASGKLGNSTSSRRFKQDIQAMDRASSVLYALKPVTFRYKPELDPQGIAQFGLVAEEVEQVDPALVARNDQGEPYTVRYEAVNAMLLNEFLKEHRKVQDLEKRLERLEQRLAARNGGGQ